MDHYTSPLERRYASPEMSALFSPTNRALTWRKIWIALAKAEKELGLPISQSQINELEENQENLDFVAIASWEKRLRHDVMAHIHAYGDVCPNAKSILHLGATSCTITDNADLIIYRKALELLRKKNIRLIRHLTSFAQTYSQLPCLGFTHFQPAQLTTVGKRASLWIQDFLIDNQEFEYREENLQLLGIKGATGTQASFLSLFDGDPIKVEALERRITSLLGFNKVFAISGQTYSRKQDSYLLSAIAGLASSAHKFANDLRLLAHLKEIEEPFNKEQVGSSAMPYKRNPMRSERICSLSRFIISLAQNPHYTAATQWLERTLDDSANRRLAIPESFLAADGVLNLLIELSQSLVVYPAMIASHVEAELPFMATENILMEAVKKGGDRQELHERLRIHSQEAGKQIKENGSENDLLARICADDSFSLDQDALCSLLTPSAYIGLAPQQVDQFLHHQVKPLLDKEEDHELSLFLPNV